MSSEEQTGNSEAEKPVTDAPLSDAAVVESPAVESPPVAASTPEQPAVDTSKMKWYVIQAHSGFELKVKQILEERIRQFGFLSSFGEIHVPQETVVELVRGQKKTSNRK